MNQENQIPQEIKRWNWGAFLLPIFWCVRHRIWRDLFLLCVPIYGIAVPFILGAKGNQKAWLKNSNEAVESFLKRQKFWARSGLAVLIGSLGITLGVFFFSTQKEIKMGIAIANCNERLSEYFGKKIERSGFSFSCNHHVAPRPSTLDLTFNATGSKNTGQIHFLWEEREGDWVVAEISYVDSADKTHYLADAPILQIPGATQKPYKKSRLEKVLDHMLQEREGHVILQRSKRNNDFMQTAIEISEKDQMPVFSVVYSHGYTQQNKQLYQSKTPLRTKEEVLQLFAAYASGSDLHRDLIPWNQLTAIEPQGGNRAYFIFGDPSEAP